MKLLALTGALLCVLVTGCDRNESTETDNAVDLDHNEQVVEREIDESRRDFLQATRMRIQDLDRKIDDLERRLQAQEPAVRAETRETIDRMQALEAQLRQTLLRAEQASRGQWHEVKEDVTRTLDDLERRYDQTLEDLKT